MPMGLLRHTALGESANHVQVISTPEPVRSELQMRHATRAGQKLKGISYQMRRRDIEIGKSFKVTICSVGEAVSTPIW